MAAYVAMAHISTARPHRRRDASVDADAWTLPASAFDLAGLGGGRPRADRLAERWSYIRDRWAQTTFFLFDADSWR